MASWHDSSVRALGRHTFRTETLWGHEAPVSWIYFSRISLGEPDSAKNQAAEILAGLNRWNGPGFDVCDTWSNLELDRHGFTLGAERLWYFRAPSTEHEPAMPAELSISMVKDPDQLAAWEYRSLWGFREKPPTVGAKINNHAPDILADPKMHVFAGRVDEEIVCGSMAYEGERSVGIYALSTLPEFRRRGYGVAISWAAISAFPNKATTTEPSESSASIFREFGFEEVGKYKSWTYQNE